jgi:hypothetical protein
LYDVFLKNKVLEGCYVFVEFVTDDRHLLRVRVEKRRCLSQIVLIGLGWCAVSPCFLVRVLVKRLVFLERIDDRDRVHRVKRLELHLDTGTLRKNATELHNGFTLPVGRVIYHR